MLGDEVADSQRGGIVARLEEVMQGDGRSRGKPGP